MHCSCAVGEACVIGTAAGVVLQPSEALRPPAGPAAAVCVVSLCDTHKPLLLLPKALTVAVSIHTYMGLLP